MNPLALDHQEGTAAPAQADDALPPFDDVYARHFPFVWRCLRTLGVPDAGLDDAAQDVFVVVHRRLAGFRGESSLRTWLFGIVRHVASNHQRGMRRKGARQEPLQVEHVSLGPGPLERAQDAEAAAFVHRFAAGLDQKKRELFVLAVLEQMSIPEVAAALSIPVNTAYTRLRSLRAEFQTALARMGGPG
jgi:RNA polymerase sigma-70 factor (ECF subfamily)